MSEPPGVASALGIEAVEWLAEGGENLTVRVTGRWRRRRPAWSAQPTLVIEGPGRRYRFPAIAEPPSLSGTGPGMWRISFAVPAALVPELGGRSWLQFGAVIVPLPAAVRPPLEAEDDTSEADAGESPAREADRPAPAPPGLTVEPAPGLTVEPAPEPAAPAAGELEAARAEVSRLSAVLADVQLARRAAEQGARAERAIRADLSRQLQLRTEEAERAGEAQTVLARAEQRVGELERELAIAAEGRRAAEHRIAVLTRDRAPGAGEPPPAPQQRHLTQERRLRVARERPRRIPDEPLGLVAAERPPRSQAAGGVGPSPAAQAITDALRQELAVRSRGEAGLHSRLIQAEARLASRQLLEQRTGIVLAELRAELEGLRGELTRERAAREAADARAERLQTDLGGARSRTQEAREAIAEIRGTLESLRGPADIAPRPSAGSEPSGGVQPERLNDALVRLRQQIAPHEGPSEATAPAVPTAPMEPPAPPTPAAPVEPPAAPTPVTPVQPPAAPTPVTPVEPPEPSVSAGPSAPAAATSPASGPAPDLGPLTVGRPWLRAAFRALAKADPDRAGQLVLDLLPAQRAVFAGAIAYDLDLGGERGCLRVTIRDGHQELGPSDSPRSPGDVDFRFSGEAAALARLLRAGRIRRRFSRRLGRVTGRRSALAALDALVSTQLGLGALYASGVRLEARTALELLARLVTPRWARDERFTLAYGAPGEAPVYLLVDGERPLEVTGNRPGAPATTMIAGPAGTLELVLRDDSAATSAVSGDPRPVRLLRDWVKRAQCG
jgi:hypothetical protein